jgi:hypothetical protein
MVCAASLAAGQVRDFSFLVLGFVELALNRKLSFPVSRMWQWCVRRSRSAVVIFASPSFKGAGRYPPAKRKFRLVEMGTAHGVCPQWPVIGMPTLEITGGAGNGMELNQHAHIR